MKFLVYTHSLISDWNHGNAHFLRGVLRDLNRRGHDTLALEPDDSWSRENLLRDQGQDALDVFHQTFPDLTTAIYDTDFDHEAALDHADVVIVHDWTDPALVERIGKARRDGGTFTLIFHDTQRSAVSSKEAIAGIQLLKDYDLVLAFGETLRQRYMDAGWGKQVFTWHEAADDTVFRPMPDVEKTRDVIWIGNWGDDESAAKIADFLIKPIKALKLAATVCGARYPEKALKLLKDAGITYGGWIANAEAAGAFAGHRMTVHIPRRPNVENLVGIPGIRVFEALACGIPLISAPWNDAEHLFRPGKDYMTAADGREMKARMRELLADPDLAADMAASGLETIHARHTCRHRVDELLDVLRTSGTKQVTDKLKLLKAAE